MLYEVYDDPEAHAAHRQSPHFLAYEAVGARAVVEKTVVEVRGPARDVAAVDVRPSVRSLGRIHVET